MSKKIISIHTGDIHLTEKKPLARAEEPDWVEAQHRVIDWLMGVVKKNECDLFIGGDLFDTVNPSYSFLNTCYPWFKYYTNKNAYVYALLGNHEQLNKNRFGMEASVWLTAKHMQMFQGKDLAGTDILGGVNTEGKPVVYGFIPATNTEEDFNYGVNTINGYSPDVVVLHKYVWMDASNNKAHVSDMSQVKHISSLFPSAKAIFCSDNHLGFEAPEYHLYNCGMLIRDNADLVDYKPRVYALYDDYSVEAIYVPDGLLALDKISDAHIKAVKDVQNKEALFLSTLSDAKDISISFEDNLNKRLENQRCKEYITGKMEEVHG